LAPVGSIWFHPGPFGSIWVHLGICRSLTNLSKQSSLTNLSKRRSLTNLSKQSSLTNLPKRRSLTNLSKRRSLTNLSKRRSLTNLSKRRSRTNLCKQRSQLGKCGSIHVLEPPSYQSLFLHLCSTRQSLPSDVACINKPKEIRHSPHSTLRRIQPYIRRTNCVQSYAHVHPYPYAQLGVITIIHLHRIVFACIDLSSAYRIPSKTLAAYS
jgi:hypothetical protein